MQKCNLRYPTRLSGVAQSSTQMSYAVVSFSLLMMVLAKGSLGACFILAVNALKKEPRFARSQAQGGDFFGWLGHINAMTNPAFDA